MRLRLRLAIMSRHPDPTFANKAMLAVDETVTGTTYDYSLGAATKYYWR